MIKPATATSPWRQPEPSKSDQSRRPAQPESRLWQVSRVLMIVDLLAPLRRGATLKDLQHDVSELMGRGFCQRTIRRDLQMLETLGVVVLARERPPQSRMTTMVARLSPHHRRAQSLAAAGMVACEAFEE